MRILYLGMDGHFSMPPLAALSQRGHEIVAVVVPAEPFQEASFQRRTPLSAAGSTEITLMPAGGAQNIVQQAWQQNLAVYAVRRPASPDFLTFVQELAPDVACVACFNRILPLALLAIPRQGFLNLHPSFLPDYRGPEPLFWQLRDGINPVGVTVHWMDEGVDTGDIAAQGAVWLPDGIGWDEIERRCAEAGAALLVRVLDTIAEGQAVRRPQSGPGSSQPLPTASDFIVDVDWTARRAFNFIRATEAWGLPYRLRGAERPVSFYRAVDWLDALSEPGLVEEVNGQIRIALAQGVLVVD